jgi:hypothetical protein
MWDGKLYRPMKLGDISLKASAKEAAIKMRRQRYVREREDDRRAIAEIYASKNARLPWPVRATGVVSDLIFRRRIGASH